jgi:hypothetical protein
MDFFPFPGNQTRCVGIQIIDDSLFRCNRTFNLTLSCDDYFVRPSPYPTSVLIIEDEPEDFELRFIDDSPQVRGNNVTANLSVGSGISSLVCSVTGEEPVDCLSGSVEFNLTNRIVPFTFFINGTTCDGNTVNLTRRFRRDQSQCSAHLINDGVTVTGDTVFVEWQGTGPSEANQNSDFICRLDSGQFNICSSTEGFMQTGLFVGSHHLIIRPAVNSLCTRRIGLQVYFLIT